MPGVDYWAHRANYREEVPMPETSLLTICAAAFLAVFIILVFLAAVIQLITLVYPSRAAGVDAALVAAITAAVAATHPGARVTRIEEKA